MFYYLDGIITHMEQGLAVVDCNGVGYACHTSQTTLSNIKSLEKTKLYTYLQVREDIFEIYGFASLEELNTFKLLIGVSGVGPKAALAILSIATPSKLALSIITGDEKMLTQASGIGKKIAQRIVLELRDKMAKEQLEGAKNSDITPIISTGSTGANNTQEAISALMVLGYSRADAVHAMDGLDADVQSSEEIIRYCLKKLAMS